MKSKVLTYVLLLAVGLTGCGKREKDVKGDFDGFAHRFADHFNKEVAQPFLRMSEPDTNSRGEAVAPMQLSQQITYDGRYTTDLRKQDDGSYVGTISFEVVEELKRADTREVLVVHHTALTLTCAQNDGGWALRPSVAKETWIGASKDTNPVTNYDPADSHGDRPLAKQVRKACADAQSKPS